MIAAVAGIALAALLQVRIYEEAAPPMAEPVRIHAPDTVVTVLVVYDPFGPSEERAVPDGTPINLYLDGHHIGRDETSGGLAYFEVAHGNYLLDGTLGVADNLRYWQCRKGFTADEQEEYVKIECEKVFLFFFPFLLVRPEEANASP